MKMKKKYRILLILLAVCILIGALAVVGMHGEWWYPVWRSMRRTPAMALMPYGFSEGTEVTPQELMQTDGVTVTDTLRLINTSHSLPEGYRATVEEYNGAYMHPEMIAPYIALRDRVQEETGVRIYVASDYRSPEEQEAILTEEGASVAAAVGCSEHEAGLALDVYAPYCAGMEFLRSPAGRMVNEICSEYGFIIRYPKGKEEITGISYEPWHLRYVGAPHACLIETHGITLEEYCDALTVGAWYQYENYVFARVTDDVFVMPAVYAACSISPDNMGGYVITLIL